jgi:Flp pilus assembly protein TadG
VTRTGRDERGAVTAELALVLPLLLAVTAGLMWFLVVGLGQVRATDAAREAARALARGEDRAIAVDLATRIGPPGSRVAVAEADGLVEVTVTARVDGPGGVLSALPGADVRATATAALEPSATGTVP